MKQQINSKPDLFRKLKPGDAPVIIDFSDSEEDIGSCYVSQANDYNRFNKIREHKYIHVSTDYDVRQIAIVCTTYEEYILEKQHKLPWRWWKDLIPSKKK